MASGLQFIDDPSGRGRRSSPGPEPVHDPEKHPEHDKDLRKGPHTEQKSHSAPRPVPKAPGSAGPQQFVDGHPKYDRRKVADRRTTEDRRAQPGNEAPLLAEAKAIEEFASRITNPAERLRYLRSQGHRHSAPKNEHTVLVHELTASPRVAHGATITERVVYNLHAGGWLDWRTWAAGSIAATVVSGIAFGLILWRLPGSPSVASNDEAAKGPAAIERIPSALEAAADLRLPPAVWQVDSTKTTETYSNGLQIDTRFTTNYQPRARYPIFAPPQSIDTKNREFVRQIGDAQEPRGIVFHTTESQLLPFEEEASGDLDRLGKSLAQLLKSEHAYHYLIDRFGRVFRIVQEGDAAGHSGFSVWADTRGLYVNLNHSFLGVAFEARTGEAEEVTAAQITAARMLTEMLRYRYSIPEENCVTHAQVSVNPDNMKLGNHTDWAHSFPFKAVGLPDNYLLPPAAVYAFGFLYDEDLIQRSAGAPWPGLADAERIFERLASDRGLSTTDYRAALKRRYQQIRQNLKQKGM